MGKRRLFVGIAEWDEQGLGGHAGGVDVFLIRAMNGLDARKQVKWNINAKRIRRPNLEDPDHITVYPVKKHHTLKRPIVGLCKGCGLYFRIKRINQRQCSDCEDIDKEFQK